MNLYALALVTSNYIAPLVAGFIADGQGWEWVIYWSSIWAAVCFVFCFFFMEETNYSRQTISPDDVLNEPSDLNVEISSVQEQNVTILGEKLATSAVVDTENGQSIPINTSTKTFVQKVASSVPLLPWINCGLISSDQSLCLDFPLFCGPVSSMAFRLSGLTFLMLCLDDFH